ncbi:50S ribosomal protein L24 [bacterium]|nr:50S ribosomal protein L24 [bacterium]
MNFKTKLKKGDTVIVSSGKENGKTGKIILMDKVKNRAKIAGLNLAKKHEKPNKNNEKGGIIEKEASIHISNLMFYCSKCNKGVRLAIDKAKDGSKIRKCIKCGTNLGK